MPEAGLVEPRPDLLDEVGGHAPPLGRRVEADAPQPVAERIGDAQRLLGLVLEGIDEDDARDVGVDVVVEGLGRPHRVTEDEDQRVRHRPGWRQAGQPRTGRRGRADAPADDRGVVHLVRHAGVDVPRPEADDRDRRRRIDDAAGRGRPTGARGQDAEDGRLVQAEGRVARLDAHDDLLAGEAIAVVERLDHRGGLHVGFPEDLAEVRQGLLGTAQDALAAGEDLHGDDGVEPLRGQDRSRALEIDVGRLA